MKTINKYEGLGRHVWATMIVGGTCLMLLGYAVAGPVVRSTEKTPRSTPVRESSDLTWPQQGPAGDTNLAPSSPPSNLPPSTPDAQQPTGPQQFPQPMPLPPTYAPGAPGGSAQVGGMDPYGGMPMAPTAFGPYGSPGSAPSSSSFGTGRPDLGWDMGGGGGAMGTPPSSGGMGGMLGYGAPPSPTPTSSLGRAAMADPSFGRYQSPNVSAATTPRQPATIGRTESQILRGNKPFANFRPDAAYSPYLRLARDHTWTPGSNDYYEWVKPLLDQQQQNSQTNRNIRGLENTTRLGYEALQQSKQRPGNTIQSSPTRAPATYMNTGNYYPGFNK